MEMKRIFICFQWDRLVVLFRTQKCRTLCCKRRIPRFPIFPTLCNVSEDVIKLLESHKVAASETSEKRLLLSHYEVFDIFEYLESYRGESNLVNLEKSLQVHLGCKSVSQLEFNYQGVCLYLDFGHVSLDWNALNDFLGIDPQYRPFSSNRNIELVPFSNKTRRKRISIRNCKIRPGVLLWEQDVLHHTQQTQRVSFYSTITKRPVTLVPVARQSPPTVIIGGFTMHRGYSSNGAMNPALDTQLKIDCLYPIPPKSRVLDICTGLGYTLIELLRRYPDLEQLITIEIEEIMAFLQEINPWSSVLTQGSCGVVHRLLGDATSILPKLPDSYFQVIIHDPPAQALQGNLYSYEFYCQIARVLSPRGQLYHYIGSPSSHEAGRLYQGVVDRLYRAGFATIMKKSQACGVLAIKK